MKIAFMGYVMETRSSLWHKPQDYVLLSADHTYNELKTMAKDSKIISSCCTKL